MQRREFLKQAGVAAAASTVAAPALAARGRIRWKMVTTWPKNFPGLGTAAERLAENIGRMSDGRLEVKVYGAGEIVPALEVFDAVQRGTAQMGHGAAYYWKGKVPAAQFFAAVPFGMTANEMNAWLFHGGGQDLWREIYRPFGLIPLAGGNTGVQMAGWFNKEIKTVDDLKGLKMRIPGLGAEVLKRAGGTPVILPGDQIFTSLSTGQIDATEWVGPYNDLAFGLYKAAKHYYYPGWQEPGSTLEALVNQEAFDELPKDLQAIVEAACALANQDMLAEYTARNHAALKSLVEDHGVKVAPLPDDVIRTLHELGREVVAEVAKSDETAARAHAAYTGFQQQVAPWTEISEHAFLRARSL